MRIKTIVHRAFVTFGLFVLSCGTQGQVAPFAIETIAGGVPNNVQGVSVDLTPSALAIDASMDNLYVADSNHLMIYKVNLSTGLLTTVAGDGVFGTPTDGRDAAFVSFEQPSGVAVDKVGNVYITDLPTNRLWKVDTSGIVHVVAGNGTAGYSGDGQKAVDAELNEPSGIAIDGHGNLYIADTFNNVIREVDTSGIIHTVAGNFFAGPGYSGDGGPANKAQLAFPAGLSIDQSANIYIADTQNNVIREVGTSGIIHTVAGNFFAGFGYSGDGGPANKAQLDLPGGVFADTTGIYIADTDNRVIRFVNFSSATWTGTGKLLPAGSIQTIAGFSGFIACPSIQCPGDGLLATQAFLGFPVGVTAFVNSVGNALLFVADPNNLRVRAVNTTTSTTEVNPVTIAGVFVRPGVIETVVGNGTGDALGQDGRGATDGPLDFPQQITEDAFGNVFFTDCVSSGSSCSSLPDNVRKIVPTFATSGVSATVQNVAGNGGFGLSSGDGAPALEAEIVAGDLFVDGCGALFISDVVVGRIRAVNTTSQPIPMPYSNFCNPSGAGQLGNIGPGDIQTVVGGGFGCSEESDALGDGCAPTQAILENPSGLFITTSHDIYIGNITPSTLGTVNNQVGLIRKIDHASGTISIVAGGGPSCNQNPIGDGCPAIDGKFIPQSVFVDQLGNIFIADYPPDASRSLVRKIDHATGIISTIAGGATASTLCPNAQNDIGDGCPATSAILQQPTSVYVDQLGEIFISDLNNSCIRMVDISGIIHTVVGIPHVFDFNGDSSDATQATLNNPTKIWGDPAGNLLIADMSNNRIRQVRNILPVPKVSLSCSPSDCSEGLTLVDGTVPSGTITVSNLGSAPLHITSVGMTDDLHASPVSTVTNFKLVPGVSSNACSTPPFDLGPKDACIVQIDLINGVSTRLAASLQIVHNAQSGASGPIIAPAPGSIGQLGQFLQNVALIPSPAPAVSYNPAILTFNSAVTPNAITVTDSGEPLVVSGAVTQGPFVLGSSSCGSIPFVLSGGGQCALNVSFLGTTSGATTCPPGTQGTACGSLTIIDNAAGATILLAGYALVRMGNAPITISSNATSSVTAQFALVGIPAGVSYTPTCIVTPAGLNVNCSQQNQTITATIAVPSCLQASATTGSNQLANLFPYATMLCVPLLLPFTRTQQSKKRRTIYVVVSVALLLTCGLALTSCGATKTSSCMASVAPGTFQLSITATPATAGSLPVLALTPPATVTVTQN